MTLVIPPLVSEQEPENSFPGGHLDPAGMEDCVGCSIVMAMNGLHPGICPATLGEAEALRAEAGYPTTGPTSIQAMLAAAHKRYGLGSVHVIGADFAQLWAALTPGRAAVLIGHPASLPVVKAPDQNLRTGEGSFAGLHCVYVQRRSTQAKVWTLDPIRNSGPGFKQGFWTSQADLRTFYVGSAAIFAIKNQ